MTHIWGIRMFALTTFILKIPRQESRCIILANYRIVLRGVLFQFGDIGRS